VAKKAEKTSRQRSPNYPAVGLPYAVELVGRLIAKDGKAGAPLEAALKQMGFSGAHGTSKAVLSALRKFRLVDDQSGRIVPTTTAIDIVRFPAAHPRRVEAIRAAALSPTIYKEIVDRYSEAGELPSDASLKPEIETDWDFNPKAVQGFLENFRESLVYAGLLDGNRLLLSEAAAPAAERGESESDQGSPIDASLQSGGFSLSGQTMPFSGVSGVMPHSGASGLISGYGQPLRAEAAGGPCIRFSLPRGNVIEIRMRAKVTAEEFAKVKQIFELSEVAFVEEEQQPNAPQTGEPCLRTADYYCLACGTTAAVAKDERMPSCPKCGPLAMWAYRSPPR
jgi:hypothetical protein